uniref:Uncharacterized protein n=1 Tax=Anguilla anguilla TaxID=7936 RepID=A0A0E9U837_ANGAN
MGNKLDFSVDVIIYSNKFFNNSFFFHSQRMFECQILN